MKPIAILGGSMREALAKTRGAIAAMDSHEIGDRLALAFLVGVTVWHWF